MYPSTSGTARVVLEQLADWKSTNKPTKLGETGACAGPLLNYPPPVCRLRSTVRVALCPQTQRRLPPHAPEGDTVRQRRLRRHQEAEPLVIAEVVRADVSRNAGSASSSIRRSIWLMRALPKPLGFLLRHCLPHIFPNDNLLSCPPYIAAAEVF